MIEIERVTKSYGDMVAVEDASFTAPSGAVTGFLGPNGAGKTTTLRILLGLARPDRGRALINGSAYADIGSPRRAVGAVIDAMGFHPGRSGRNHLRVSARSAGIPENRADKVLELVNLSPAADRAVRRYSHGMRQRLALAAALLGDPQVLVLDEPTIGLDPAGMAWFRRLLKAWASRGRTVLFSTHILAEVEAVADHVVIIDRGHIVHEGSKAGFRRVKRTIVARTTDIARLRELASREGWRTENAGRNRLAIFGPSASTVGKAAARARIALSELSTETRQLEDLFLELTGTEGDDA